jgi:SAM-dependent methyltransferase
MLSDGGHANPISAREDSGHAPAAGMKLVSEAACGVAVSDTLKENYDSYYGGESAWRALGAIGKVQNIVDLCGALPHNRILDVGSGEGALLRRLSDLNFGEELYSLEISQSGVAAILQRNIRRVRECRLFDGYAIPYESRQFDLAILSHVLEHTEYPRKLLYEAARVADYVFVEVPLEDTIMLKPDFVFDSVGHINFYSRKTIRRLVQTCDLRVLSQVVTNPSRAVYEYQSGRKGIMKYMLKGFLLGAAERLACGLFTYHCSIVCTKDSA